MFMFMSMFPYSKAFYRSRSIQSSSLEKVSKDIKFQFELRRTM